MEGVKYVKLLVRFFNICTFMNKKEKSDWKETIILLSVS